MDGRMRVILKSGGTFEFDAVDLAVRTDWRSHLGKLDWKQSEDWQTDVLYLERHEVTAVIVTRARGAGPREPALPHGLAKNPSNGP